MNNRKNSVSSQESTDSTNISILNNHNPFAFASGIQNLPLDNSTPSTTSSVEGDDQLANSLDVTEASFMFTQSKMQKRNSDKNSPVMSLVTSSAKQVNDMVKLMKRLQAVEDQLVQSEAKDLQDETNHMIKNQCSLIKDLTNSVKNVKAEILNQVPQRHRNRLLPQGDLIPLFEFPLLFGRCFNLSLNLKILSGGSCLDPNITSRVISDLCVLQKSLEIRLNRREELKCNSVVSTMLNDMDINLVNERQKPRFGFL